MIKVKDYEAFNQRRYSNPWIAVFGANGRVGVSKCNPGDQFDILYGTSLATLRAYKGKDANIEKRVTYCVSEDKQ